MFEFDKKYFSKYSLIAGIDEAGRGPLAGPVVASSVVFSKETYIKGVNDSKKVSAKKRNLFYDEIISKALYVGIGIVHSKEIDELNILEATKNAMRLSVLDLGITPDLLLVDGNQIEFPEYNQENIIKGDSKSFSIASASIIAKVTRDRMMDNYAKILPQYGFEKHKGYGTKYHFDAISKYKSSVIHRKSFNPVKNHLASFKYYSENNILNGLLVQIAGDYLIKTGYNILRVDELSIYSSKNGKVFEFQIDSNITDYQSENNIYNSEKSNCRLIKINFKKGNYSIKTDLI